MPTGAGSVHSLREVFRKCYSTKKDEARMGAACVQANYFKSHKKADDSIVTSTNDVLLCVEDLCSRLYSSKNANFSYSLGDVLSNELLIQKR